MSWWFATFCMGSSDTWNTVIIWARWTSSPPQYCCADACLISLTVPYGCIFLYNIEPVAKSCTDWFCIVVHFILHSTAQSFRHWFLTLSHKSLKGHILLLVTFTLFNALFAWESEITYVLDGYVMPPHVPWCLELKHSS